MSDVRTQRGFTLVEVMIALAILFAALVMMLSRVTADTQATNRAKLMTAATGLARGKMLDLEEDLLFKGFQDTSEDEDGDFSDEGFPRFSWKAKIEKIELPPLQQLQQGQGAAAASKNADGTSTGAPGSGLTSLMGTGAGGGSASSAQGASALSGSFDMVSKILESAIRKVTLTVSWKAGNRDETLVIVCYFTDPKAVDQGLGGLLQGGAAAANGDTAGKNGQGGAGGAGGAGGVIK
jgi:general secretion pathway protein I